jgi:hypothetical protein
MRQKSRSYQFDGKKCLKSLLLVADWSKFNVYGCNLKKNRHIAKFERRQKWSELENVCHLYKSGGVGVAIKSPWRSTISSPSRSGRPVLSRQPLLSTHCNGFIVSSVTTCSCERDS